MKKNIIIAGTARSGKSTLSSLISKTFGYQHLAMDALIEGFEDLFPEMNIDTHRDSIGHISSKIAPFINAIIKSGEYDKFDYGLVIDVCQLMPDDYLKYIDQSLCDIFYLISDCESVEERLELLDKYDDEKEYTFFKSKDQRLKLCKDLVEDTKVFKKACEKVKIPYFDTSKDRDGQYDIILNHIKENS